MQMLNGFKKKVFSMTGESFDQLALEVFHFQAKNNEIYRHFIEHLGVRFELVDEIHQIPFMPIEFFKSQTIKTLNWKTEHIFKSSGTTGSERSLHHIQDLEFYLTHSKNIFESFMNAIDEWKVYALLPSYQEQNNSSLIAMVDHLMEHSQSLSKEYYKYKEEYKKLYESINRDLTSGKNVLLFGVAYALLDFGSFLSEPLDGLCILETGGMKGRRDEIVKEEYYGLLRQSFGKVRIISEYGMTEMMSQAYAMDGQFYTCSPSMKVLIRDLNDPFNYVQHNNFGGINVIDLGNVHSCAFIETKDIGKTNEDGQFAVLGRVDSSDIRGCNLLMS